MLSFLSYRSRALRKSDASAIQDAENDFRSFRDSRVPESLRVYAVGDVHGRADLLKRLLEQIDADIALHPARHPVHVFLGDYIDRGPGSREVLDLLIDRSASHHTVCLRGNHEDCAMRALANPDELAYWLRIGGLATLTSYGVSGPKTSSSTDILTSFRGKLPDQHLSFMQDLPHYFECGDYCFAHAGLRPGIRLEAQSSADLMWIRDEFLRSTADHGKRVVHGHTPVQKPQVLPNRINIDTGAYMSNKLTCLVLDDAKQHFIVST